MVLLCRRYRPILRVMLFYLATLRKQSVKKIKHFEKNELKTFLDYLDNLDSNRYRYFYEVTLYKFLLATGCRINEALALSWSDIDLDNAVVHVTKTLNRELEINSPKSKLVIGI